MRVANMWELKDYTRVWELRSGYGSVLVRPRGGDHWDIILRIPGPDQVALGVPVPIGGEEKGRWWDDLEEAKKVAADALAAYDEARRNGLSEEHVYPQTLEKWGNEHMRNNMGVWCW